MSLIFQPNNTESRTLRQVMQAAVANFAPPPDLKVSEWADMHRKLSQGVSALPGKWNTDAAPFQRGMMDAVHEDGISDIVIMAASQVGKTEVINNIVGYFIHQDPSPMLLIQPTLDMAKTWSKDRLMPMLRDSEVFNGIIDTRDRCKDNTQLYKKFVGGYIAIAGANSPASLASRPVRFVLVDEEDRYADSAGNEGDPSSMAKARSRTFWNRLFVAVSSPTDQTSKISARYENSDRRKYYVPCTHCGHQQTLQWANIIFEKTEKRKICGDVHYKCEDCGALMSEGDKYDMLRKGEWRREGESGHVAGFHINALYSPFYSWRKIVEDFLEAQDNLQKLKAFFNTVLAEIWQEKTEKLDYEPLLARKEHFSDCLPEGAVFLTCGVDVQKDRIEAEIVGWGIGKESWSIGYHILYGSPLEKDVWRQLTALLDSPYIHRSGVILRIDGTCIDTGGDGWTQDVYDYCRIHKYKRVFAVKGASEYGKPLVGKPSKQGKPPVQLFSIGTDQAKYGIAHNLRLHMPGPGYCHFPHDREEEWFKQLTGEQLIRKKVKGRDRHVWAPISGRRNEALDCRVYATAALAIRNPRLEGLTEELRVSADVLTQPPKANLVPALKQDAPAQKKSSWVGEHKGWMG